MATPGVLLPLKVHYANSSMPDLSSMIKYVNYDSRNLVFSIKESVVSLTLLIYIVEH